MTTWYVRPDTSHSVTRDGTSSTAWGGWASIVWGGAGVHVRGCTFNGDGNSMVLFLSFNGWSYTDCIIDGNIFLGGAGAIGGSAIQWYATSTGSVTSLSNLQINNNTFAGCSATRAVILLKALNAVAAGTKMTDIVVSGNTFTDCGAVMMEIYGPEVYGRNTGIKVRNNTIRDQTLVGIIGGGIVLGGFVQSLTADFGGNDIHDNKAYELNGMSGFVNLFYGTYKISFLQNSPEI